MIQDMACTTLSVVVILIVLGRANGRSFSIDYDHDTFLKDGEPFRYISGSMHYSRVPSLYWRDRLEKLYAAGLNAVQTYVPWNFHESSPGEYNFDGDRDIVEFIKTAQDVGLLVILRAGPYICGEWDMGGLPSWLLRDKSIALRTSDPVYLKHVDNWMSVLLPKMNPLLYENGGPIITVQVENEYGSYYACDKNYLQHLETVFRKHLGPTAVLFTTDGASDYFLKCGAALNSSLYATVDFGITSDPAQLFKSQRDYEPHGPLVNSEFYTGWLDYWGHPHQTRNSTQVADTLDAILKLNASVNMYMFEGGTNFGFWSGADPPYKPVPTSYDYDAPLTEAGDPWEKFTLIRDVISKYKPVPSHIPTPSPKASYGKVQFTEYADLYLCPELVVNTVTAENPVTMETLNQSSGFVIYSSKLPSAGDGKLTIYGLHDRASIYIAGKLQGTIMRVTDSNLTLDVNVPFQDSSLDIVVENMGRLNYGNEINDSKGILFGVSFNGLAVKGWKSQAVPLNNLSQIPFKKLNSSTQNSVSVSFFRGVFHIKGHPQDTYLNVTGWSKGQAFVNGVNLGRYWPVRGPQVTLYVPGIWLKAPPATNELVLFEIDSAPCAKPFENCFATLVATPDIGGG